jgi:hypothetical protein
MLAQILEDQQRIPISASIHQWNLEETKQILEKCDLAMPLLLWDYPSHYKAFLEFMDWLIERKIPLANDPFIIKWSSNKLYLKVISRKNN